MIHVILLGDSIFDNARYVPGGPPVIEQLRDVLPRGSRETLLAVDGAIASDVPRQLAPLPGDATHLFISAGGNNALMHRDLIDGSSGSAAGVARRMAEVQRSFRTEYRAMLDAVIAVGRPTCVCTIYDAIPGLPPEAVTALSIFNDVIVREALGHNAPVLDLREVCDSPNDYSSLSPIEPSVAGGAKIARAMSAIVAGHDFSGGQTVVYGRRASEK